MTIRITIAERLRPFSHTPGTYCLLPGTPYQLRIYPTRVEIVSISSCDAVPPFVIDLQLQGPAADFTIQQDLEKCCVLVWGHYQEGFVRYRIFSKDSGVFFEIERCPDGGLILFSPDKHLMTQKQSFQLPVSAFDAGTVFPTRLSLGSHKAQDGDLIRRRGQLEEIFPLWFRLGMLFGQEEAKTAPEHPLLERCAESVLNRDILKIYAAFKTLFLAGFRGLLCPRLEDDEFQGLYPKNTTETSAIASPLILLSQGAAWIRQIFLQVQQDTLIFLPALPPEFHAGRMTDLVTPFGEVDLEWSKKSLRRAVLRCKKTLSLSVLFSKELKAFRLHTNADSRGKIVPIGQPLDIVAGELYFLDNFTR